MNITTVEVPFSYFNKTVSPFLFNFQPFHTSSSAMKKTKLSHSHPPTITEKPQQQEDEEETKEEEHDNEKPYILQLPNHVIVEILCKIPIKTLIQCRCVCKSWRCSLSDPQFTNYLFSRTPTCVLLQNSSSRNPKSTGLFLLDLDKACSRNDVVIKLPKDPNVPTLGVQILGSCNGFLCVYDRLNYGRFYMSNPVIGESLNLPTPKKEIDYPFVCGFGFSPISDVYKVVVITSTSEGSDAGEAMVLTVGSGIWRSIGNSGYPFVYQSYGIYLNGFLHWVVRSKSCFLICAFDVENESFQELPMPPGSSKKCIINVGVLKGWFSLFVRSNGNINVWVMKDYGIEESWTKDLVIRKAIPFTIGSSSSEFGYSTSSSSTQVLKFTKKGQVLLLQKFQLKVYTPGKKGTGRLEVDGIPLMVEAFVYIPSFVSIQDVVRG